MDTLLLQDWITVQGFAPTVSAITQAADSWLDMGDYEDIVLYADATGVTGTVLFAVQTAPSRQETSFVNMFNAGGGTPAGVHALPLLGPYAGVPVSRFLRWQVTTTGTGLWGATFRLLLAAYSL